ncbi:SRPBCC family protein [Paenibacillus sp. strain BS8-2]
MDGTIIERAGGTAILFQRQLKHSKDEVWQAITDPNSIKMWLTATADIEHFEGGKLELRWDNGDVVTGKVMTYKPNNKLSYTWTEETSGESIVSFQLSDSEQGTLLTLEHLFYKTNDLPSFLSGWHVHLDVIDLVLNGESFEFPWARQKELQFTYKGMIQDGRH